MDLAKYLDLYLTEGREHLELMRKGLEGDVSPEAVNDLFRHAHSIKGMAASMTFEPTAGLAHRIESLLGRWRAGEGATPGQMSAVTAAIDVLHACFDAVQTEGTDASMEGHADRASAALEAGAPAPRVPDPVKAAPPAPHDLPPPVQAPGFANGGGGILMRVAIDPACPLPAARLMVVSERIRSEVPGCSMDPDLDRVRAGSLRSATFTLPPEAPFRDLGRAIRELPDVAGVEIEQPAAPARGVPAHLVQNLRVAAEDMDDLRADAAELLFRLNEFEASLDQGERRKHRFWLDSERALLTRHFDRILAIRLVSFEVLVERLGRAAREVAGRVGKQVRLEVAGAEQRVDRGILERLLDPLLHLVRNAVDHGLETPEERRRAGKPEEGTLRLDIHRESESLLVSLEDDGRGIDIEGIRQAAVERLYLSPQEAALLDRSALLMLLTQPAFSTRREVTEVSGRGVGLDVVRAAVEALGGHLEMHTAQGTGSRFTLAIPSATTLTRVLVFGWEDGVRYGIPASQVRHIYPLSTFPLVWSGNRRFLQAGDELLPVLGWRPGPVGREGAGLRLIAPERDRVLLVSEVYQGERVVILPWGPPLERVSEWMGGALLATGEIATILDGRVLVRREDLPESEPN